MPDTSRQGAPDTARRDNVETFEWLTGFLRRVIRRAGKRVADADEVELRVMIQLASEWDDAIQVAVDGMRARGVSWSVIGDAAGMRKQSAQEKWGRSGERDVA